MYFFYGGLFTIDPMLSDDGVTRYSSIYYSIARSYLFDEFFHTDDRDTNAQELGTEMTVTLYFQDSPTNQYEPTDQYGDSLEFESLKREVIHDANERIVSASLVDEIPLEISSVIDMDFESFVMVNNAPSFNLDCDGDGEDDDPIFYAQPFSSVKQYITVNDIDRDNITLDFIYNETIFYFDFEFTAFDS